MAKGDKSSVPATPMKSGGTRSEASLDLMMTKSSWMQMFSPTLVRQAVWMNLGGELVVPIAFGVEEIAPGRQVVARQAFMPADPSQVPLPQTPVKQNESSTGVFGSKGSPYIHDSHMVTLRSASRQDRVVKENEALRPTPNTYKGSAQQQDRRYDLNEDSSDDGKYLLDVDNLEGDLTGATNARTEREGREEFDAQDRDYDPFAAG
ncbi:hypothetical protein PHMEG_00031554 [Phytophthora megakarya]|uniref:Eukaryotic/viral aspartic protease n=1 Tax=Phytophthora megakarya TaxID=4795 RepID=A0A225UXX9_9STRA|nr:hypothetical protein PHMEG_00031554 [Phytophthora megakarya]